MSQVLHEAERVVYRRMRVARTDGVADAEELEGAFGIAQDGLRLAVVRAS